MFLGMIFVAVSTQKGGGGGGERELYVETQTLKNIAITLFFPLYRCFRYHSVVYSFCIPNFMLNISIGIFSYIEDTSGNIKDTQKLHFPLLYWNSSTENSIQVL